MLIAETPQCLAAPKKLPPIFPCCLYSTICNRPLVPFYFIGSRAANYHYSLALRAFFNIAIDARPAERWVPQWCQTQAAWHGVRFWSFSRTLWIGCARPLQLLTGVCLSIASLVKPQRLYICTAAYTVRCWCAFFFFLNLSTQSSLYLCKLLIWNNVALGFRRSLFTAPSSQRMIVSVGQGFEEKVSLLSLSSELVLYSSGKKSVFHPPHVTSTIEVVVCVAVSLPDLQSGFCGFQYHCNCRGQVHSWGGLTRVISESVFFHTNLYCYVQIKL